MSILGNSEKKTSRYCVSLQFITILKDFIFWYKISIFQDVV